jgi:hypothetical protein
MPERPVLWYAKQDIFHQTIIMHTILQDATLIDADAEGTTRQMND